MTSYLVTGAAGFIGSHVVDRLLGAGHRVIGVDDLSAGTLANVASARDSGLAFSFHAMDVADPRMRPLLDRYRPGVVLHLAARASVGGSVIDPVTDAEVTIVGTLRLLEECVRAGVRRVVVASSGGTIYGDSPSLPTAEGAIRRSRPVSPYGISKRVVLDYLAFLERYRGIDWVALALGNVYGPRQSPSGESGVVAAYLDALLGGRPMTVFGDGHQTRDFVYVDDVVQAFVLATERGHGQVVNVGTGIETSILELARMLAATLGIEAEIRHLPARPAEVRRSALDNRHAATVLGWRPWTHLEDGLKETIAHLRGI